MAYVISFIGGYLLCLIHSQIVYKVQKPLSPLETTNQEQWERLLNFSGGGEE